MSSLSSATVQANQDQTNLSGRTPSRLGRYLFFALGAIALLYALVAGLQTVFDADIWWQLATGRWIAQHHRIFSTDVFSYTASGQPWIYPVGSALLFYGVYLLDGYSLLSWLGAAVCVGTFALLLRRGSAFTAALAIVAVPLIAMRSTPRAEIFTAILFAAFLSLLWENYETGRARLWLLPLLMVAWVNFHLGFISGLGLMAAFVGFEVLELPFSAERRRAALGRLKRALPWYAATTVATLVNPWGWGLYTAIIRQDRAMAQHSQMIAEWSKGKWNWSGSIPSFSQQPMQNALTMLMMIGVLAAFVAMFRGRFGPAILLLGALYESMRYIRMEALTACVVVLVGGVVLAEAASQMSRRIADWRVRSAIAIAAAAFFAVIAVVRGAAYVTDRVNLAGNSSSDFGIGLAQWLPQGAADFINREKLPANIFNTYNIGGFTTWALGQNYRDYIDGRAIPFGPDAIPNEERLLVTPLDSPEWQKEADQHNINTMILPISDGEIALSQVPELCYSENWKPVYLDEVSLVLVRRKPENQDVINRLQVNCPTVSLPVAPQDHSAKSFARWVDAANVLLVLNRVPEALAAANTAYQIFPDSGRLRSIRGDIFYSESRHTEAEQEWLAALALSPNQSALESSVWSHLGELYQKQDRAAEALHAWQEAAKLTSDPIVKTRAYVNLARLYLRSGHAETALQALDDAEHAAPPVMLQATGGRSFKFDLAQGRAAAWRSLGDFQKATSYEEEAVKLDPDAADAWAHLAKLYQRQGREADQHRAEEKATALGAASNK